MVCSGVCCYVFGIFAVLRAPVCFSNTIEEDKFLLRYLKNK